MARLISGDDLVSYSPLDAVGALGGRPLFITHGTSDERLSVAYGHTLEEAVRADGGNVETWYVDGGRAHRGDGHGSRRLRGAARRVLREDPG